jgi:large subunit ribosomal protein L24
MKPLVYKKSKRKKSGPVYRHKMQIVKGDQVRVISGDHKGKEGRILRVDRKRRRVVVEGINIVKRHKQKTGPDAEGGIIEFEAPLDASNVMLLDPKSGEPTRIRRQKDKDGTIERISVKSGQSIAKGR